MNPVKVRTILPTIAVEHKEDLELLQRLNTFYWDKIRTTLSTTDEAVVEVLGLGKFFRKYSSLVNLKNRLLNYIQKPRLNEVTKTSVQKDIDHINKSIEFIHKENQRKSLKKSIKDEYKKNMG